MTWSSLLRVMMSLRPTAELLPADGSTILHGGSRTSRARAPRITGTLHVPRTVKWWKINKQKKQNKKKTITSAAQFMQNLNVERLNRFDLHLLLSPCSTPYLQQCRETLRLPTMHGGS